MFKPTPTKPVLLTRTLNTIIGCVLSVAAISLYIVFGGFFVQPSKAYAATNSTINFQARLEGAGGNIAADGYYNVQFNLYNAGTGGTALWTETYYDSNGITAGNDNRVQVVNGYLTVSLGSQTAFPSTINWDQDLWVTLNIGGTAQTATPTWDGEMNPRLKLTGVPYAFRAGQLAQFNNTTGFTSTLNILQPTVGNQTFNIADQGAAGTYTLCIQNSTACGFAAGSGSANYIQNQNASAQATSNFWISGTGIASTSLLTPLLDTPSGTTTLNIGTTNATAGINLNQNVVVAAGKALTIAGGITSTRPASPVAGMLYYDSTTATLLTYNGSKWVSDKSTANKIVAMGTATGCTGTSPVASANPDGADYVTTSCTSAQTVINSAIAALPAAGGTVFLMDGTYIIDGAITLNSNVTLAGAGAATIIKIKDSAANMNMISASTKNRITIRDLKLDGNKLNETNTHHGIDLSSVGSGSGTAAVPGATITGVEASNLLQQGLYMNTVANSRISNSSFINNGNNSSGVYITGSTNVNFTNLHVQGSSGSGFWSQGGTGYTITGSTFEGNVGGGTSAGVYIQSGSNITVSGNTMRSNGTGVSTASGASYLTFTGNTIMNSTGEGMLLNSNNMDITGNTITGNTTGIYLSSMSNNEVNGNLIANNSGSGVFLNNANYTAIEGNTLQNNTAAGSGSSIEFYYFSNPNSGNVVRNNSITDTAGTGCAISVNSGATGAVLSGNTYSGTGANCITDNGVGTQWVNQADASGNALNVSPGGGFAVGASSANASLSLQGGLKVSALPAPTLSATVTNVGTAGTTTHRYQVTALDGLGETTGSTVQQTTTGNATLSATNYNTITWTPVGGAVQYKIYRCTGASCTPLLLATVAGNASSYNDQANGAPSGAVPGVNTTGGSSFAGPVLLQNSANSTTAFQVQNAAGTSNLLIADTTNTVIKIGTAGSATQAGSALFVTSAEVSAALRIGDATNNVQFDGTTHEPTLNGTARHTRKIVLAAEYAGASMTADGTNNTGTMTSDNMTTSPYRNYYKWANTQGTAQDYDIWVKVPLPSDFAALPAGQTICIDTYASALTANGVKLTLYDTSNAVVGTSFDLTPTVAANSWENKCTTSITAGTYAADGTMTLDIKLTAPATTGDIRIGTISFSYLSKW